MKMMLGSLTIFRYLYNNNFSQAKQSHFDFSISSIEWGSLNATNKKTEVIKQHLLKNNNPIMLNKDMKLLSRVFFTIVYKKHNV